MAGKDTDKPEHPDYHIVKRNLEISNEKLEVLQAKEEKLVKQLEQSQQEVTDLKKKLSDTNDKNGKKVSIHIICDYNIIGIAE